VTVQNSRKKLRVVLSICAVAISTGLGVCAAGAQDTHPTTAASAKPQKASAPADAAASANASRPYYVDFRARTAATYGHAFVWYGRVGDRKVEVAGLHPASDSPVPYILGHIIPVPSETGKSYGDLDEQYLTAHYRVLLTEAEAQRVFAYIRRLQASTPLWNAAVYNCVAFIQDIARYTGLRVPGNHWLYPEDWVNRLRQLNSGREQTARAPAPKPARATEAAAH
jgi:hypothetical protein